MKLTETGDPYMMLLNFRPLYVSSEVHITSLRNIIAFTTIHLNAFNSPDLRLK
jgi:hypothetical protein